jgi:peptide/nickel transport system permease protein
MSAFDIAARRRAIPATAWAGIAIVGAAVLGGLAAPWLTSASPTEIELAQRLMPPSARHWLGTDQLGRDIFARLAHGARASLGVVVMVVALVAPLGIVVGAISGALGGRTDAVLMRLTDVVMAFPRLILALALAAALGPGLENAVLAIALTAWPAYARLARAETLGLRERDHINAIRLLGGSETRIVFGHILPLLLPSALVRATLDMAGIILTAAGLGFLGLGAPPPAPEWGAMIAEGRQFLLDAWWVATVPGLAILVVSLGFNLLGDGLRDMVDARSG